MYSMPQAAQVSILSRKKITIGNNGHSITRHKLYYCASSAALGNQSLMEKYSRRFTSIKSRLSDEPFKVKKCND